MMVMLLYINGTVLMDQKLVVMVIHYCISYYKYTTVTFSWDNGAITPNQSGLGAGTYIVTVTNSLGCTATATAVITELHKQVFQQLWLMKLVHQQVMVQLISVSGGTGCQVGATVNTAGSHLSNYNGYARGWSFTAQLNSFILSYVKASDGNTTPGLVNQSIEILDITQVLLPDNTFHYSMAESASRFG